ncbi:MAG: linear amide C-N hydrolase [Helicobacteraceae bacterium]|nr:linear amide C-N hydrolase [Helicobacteraceae bacterium]
MRIVTKVTLALVATTSLLNACGNIFVNKGGFHVEGRTMEFGANIANEVIVRFVGQKQTSNIMTNLDKIPQDQILSWEYKNGFVGRGDEWRPSFTLDGLNEKGVSVSFLYAPGITTYPEYNKKDKRKVISAYEMPIYILTMADSTADAIKKIKKLQWVNAGFEIYPGQYVKNVPMHISIRDKSGNSAVVEWIDGKTVINTNAKNVMTNSPAYPKQLKNVAKYSSLKTTNTKMNKNFEKRFINYKTIFNMPGARAEQTALMGLPADFTPPSRFVRGTVLLDNMIAPQNSTHARRQATDILGAIATIGVNYSDLALWYTVKDLDNLVVYYQELYFFQSPTKLIARDPATGFTTYDLKDIDFKTLPIGFSKEYKALTPKEAKKLTIKAMPQ